ncbi:MAG: hypothetical protein ACK5RN_09695 [bacterium]
MLKPGVIIAMALGCCACVTVDNPGSISGQWLGRWAEETRWCNDPASESWRVADLYRAMVAGDRPPAEPARVAALVGHARQLAAEGRL